MKRKYPIRRNEGGGTAAAGPLAKAVGVPAGEGLAARSIAQYLQGGPLGGGNVGISYGGDNSSGGVDWHKKAGEFNKAQQGDRTAIVDQARQDKRDAREFLATDQNAVQASGDSSYANVAAPSGYDVGTTTLPSGEVVPAYTNTTFKSGPNDTRTETQALREQIREDKSDERFGTVGAGGVDILGGTSLGNAIKALTSTPDPYNGAGTDGAKGAQGGGLKSEIGGAYDPRGGSGGSVASTQKDSGSSAISGGGSDGVGNWGAVGDFFGGIGDSLGVTNYSGNNDDDSSSSSSSSDSGGGGGWSWWNEGGQVVKKLNNGGYSDEEAQKKAQIAQTNVATPNIQQQVRQAQAQMQGGGGGGAGGALGGILKKGLASGLSGALGPLGGLLGGLFNDGGPIPQQLNAGGPAGPLNPNGYKEGGAVGPTPIKRVADEQKIELDKMTWDRMEGRKDQQMMLDEKRKQEAFGLEQGRKAEAHTEAMKMKKAAATTNKAPLSGG